MKIIFLYIFFAISFVLTYGFKRFFKKPGHSDREPIKLGGDNGKHPMTIYSPRARLEEYKSPYKPPKEECKEFKEEIKRLKEKILMLEKKNDELKNHFVPDDSIIDSLKDI